MAGIEDLYQNLFNRAPDAEGLAYWQQQQANGMSITDIEAGFKNSAEFQGLQSATQPTTVLGKDISGLRWDDVAQEVHGGKVQQNERSNNGTDMQSSYTYSNILGGEVQGYVDTTQANRNWKGSSREGGVDVYDWQSLSSIHLKDEAAPEGYMTKLYRTDDGGVGVTYYEQQNGFVRDMILFVATAMGMYGAVTAMGAASSAGATSGASGTAGTAASGAGEVSMAELGGEAATQTGFQASHLTAPWEQVATNTLGSGMSGIETVDGLLQLGTVGADGSFSLGGMTLFPDGTLISAGDMFGAAAPWVNPGSSTITDAVINSAGSIGDLMAGVDPWSQYVAGLGDVLSGTPPAPETNWWDKVVDAAKDAVTDVAKDVVTGIVTGTVVDKVINGRDGKDGAPGGTGNLTINIPKPDPSAAALQPSASQRAGVKFGRTRSKRQLKGKFSGTGLSL